jgi:adenine deaminase
MSSFVIRDVRVFTGDVIIETGFVHVENGKIKAVGPMPDAPQTSIKTYSKPGHTLLPGLIDCHIHADMADPQALPQALRFGVTTVCEMQNEIENVLKLKKQTLEPDTASYKTAGSDHRKRMADTRYPGPRLERGNEGSDCRLAQIIESRERDRVS